MVENEKMLLNDEELLEKLLVFVLQRSVKQHVSMVPDCCEPEIIWIHPLGLHVYVLVATLATHTVIVFIKFNNV